MATAMQNSRFACVFALLAAGAHADIVRIDSGRIRGTVTADPDVRVYRGIPFAQPPVAKLRWRPPQPVAAWPEVRDCVAYGPSCVQPAAKIIKEVEGERSEDCLYLNVWTSGTTGVRRPVMVWIHGGGFTIGSGAQKEYDGQSFAANGAVLVTINYRLGPLGFMAHPALSAESPRGISGNYGLLDQIAALQWVKRNIAAFGGDPRNVTIFGESAGGVSVGCLLASPLAKGLFHRAIMQSGVAARSTPLRGTPVRGKSAETAGIEVARQLGIQGNAKAAALRAVPADKLLKAANPRVGLFGKGQPFWPCVDGHVLPEPPLETIVSGEHNDVPVMLGSNADEGTLFLRQLPIKRPMGYRWLLRTMFREDASRVQEIFPVTSAADVKTALNRVVTASGFVATTRRVARALADARSPVWLYHFSRVSPIAERTGMGATHGAEIMYVFRTLPRWLQAEADKAVAETMHAAWLRFAQTGDPNGGNLPKWLSYTPQNDAHLTFGDSPEAGRDLLRKECDLFDEIAPRR
ncbi:MAG: carboxylesterase family protein [Lentisphaerae bacterium]|nr:carboxylesterase family protein [Lentisphaerota bacterium]MBT4819872.1 carboxylesterase family protein [Lentisphaerota bacterium]MBT5605072.1 carboxylesterase family protein [Lentisphaerota bacterium]MBT7062243.1 carboxylesterase family protein [Lentisphaerota bacterium]MBT7847035.1 carboxylesterase family protein [Lentisphaerota bacterium]